MISGAAFCPQVAAYGAQSDMRGMSVAQMSARREKGVQNGEGIADGLFLQMVSTEQPGIPGI